MNKFILTCYEFRPFVPLTHCLVKLWLFLPRKRLTCLMGKGNIINAHLSLNFETYFAAGVEQPLPCTTSLSPFDGLSAGPILLLARLHLHSARELVSWWLQYLNFDVGKRAETSTPSSWINFFHVIIKQCFPLLVYYTNKQLVCYLLATPPFY